MGEFSSDWDGEADTMPCLPQLPRHYSMAWLNDEKGAPMSESRADRYDERRKGNVAANDIVDGEEFTDGHVDLENVQEKRWSDSDD